MFAADKCRMPVVAFVVKAIVNTVDWQVSWLEVCRILLLRGVP